MFLLNQFRLSLHIYLYICSFKYTYLYRLNYSYASGKQKNSLLLKKHAGLNLHGVTPFFLRSWILTFWSGGDAGFQGVHVADPRNCPDGYVYLFPHYPIHISRFMKFPFFIIQIVHPRNLVPKKGSQSSCVCVSPPDGNGIIFWTELPSPPRFVRIKIWIKKILGLEKGGSRAWVVLFFFQEKDSSLGFATCYVKC